MSLLDSLLAAGSVVTDGAWGTELQSRGLTNGVCPDVWNLSHPWLVEEVARAYVAAGGRPRLRRRLDRPLREDAYLR